MMIRKTIRVHRRDSAFVYAILESLEGMTSYSTLDARRLASSATADNHNAAHCDYRDLELFIAPGFAQEVEVVLNGMKKKFPIVETQC